MSKNLKVLITIFVLVTIILFSIYFILFRGFYAESDKVVGEYNGTASIDKFTKYEAWQIGKNKYGQPVFVDYKKAFKFLQDEYADVLEKAYDIYHEEYNIGRIDGSNFGLYKILIHQMPADNEELRKRNVLVAQFIDIYENSLKRWIYIPGFGWDRICP